MRSVVDRNVVIRRIPVHQLMFSCTYWNVIAILTSHVSMSHVSVCYIGLSTPVQSCSARVTWLVEEVTATVHGQFETK